MSSQLRSVRRSDIRRLSTFLGRAFADDPIMRYCFPDDATRERKVAWLQARGVAHGRLYGMAETTDDLAGVVVWFRPGERSMPVLGGLRSGLIWVPCRLGPTALLRLARYYSSKKRLRASCVDREHWYLFLVAADPERHGENVGGRLIEGGLSRIDRKPKPCYLETTREENIAYFERFGFEVRGKEEVTTDGGRPGPVVWGMVRESGAG